MNVVSHIYVLATVDVSVIGIATDAIASKVCYVLSLFFFVKRK